ncbi:MAG: hypothetical protein ABW170_09160 [Candidatus Thiodiazotropha sp. L084R]
MKLECKQYYPINLCGAEYCADDGADEHPSPTKGEGVSNVPVAQLLSPCNFYSGDLRFSSPHPVLCDAFSSL